MHFYRQVPEPPEGGQKPWRIEARENVFDSGRILAFMVLPPSKFQPEVDQPLFPRSMAWSESKNLYTGGMLTLGEFGRGASLHAVRTLDEWQTYWDLKDTGSSHGRLLYEGSNVQSRKTDAPETITAADFRLHANSNGKGSGTAGRDLGADVGNLGPGKAYEAWKKTKDYGQWLVATGQARPFVVLAADKSERTFSTLAEAAAAAASGEVIEIRGNGPFVTPKITINDKRALVIRAARVSSRSCSRTVTARKRTPICLARTDRSCWKGCTSGTWRIQPKRKATTISSVAARRRCPLRTAAFPSRAAAIMPRSARRNRPGCRCGIVNSSAPSIWLSLGTRWNPSISSM